MRKKIVAGNWKMNKTYPEGLFLLQEIKDLLLSQDITTVIKIIAPPFIHLPAFSDLIKDLPNIATAAQNCYVEQNGAYTGEVSAGMIKSTGASYVIIGHSERRTYFGETPALLLKKVDIVLKNELQPIFCVGETLRERESGHYFNVISQQLEESLFQLDAMVVSNLVIAYEPVWAIGTGMTATVAQAQEMHQFIRSLFKEQYNAEVADNVSILYGGSCNTENAAELFACADVDGGLIGGASLKAKDFIAITNSFNFK